MYTASQQLKGDWYFQYGAKCVEIDSIYETNDANLGPQSAELQYLFSGSPTQIMQLPNSRGQQHVYRASLQY